MRRAHEFNSAEMMARNGERASNNVIVDTFQMAMAIDGDTGDGRTERSSSL